MPIKIDSNLPAHKLLENENVFVMTEERAVSQDIRPLKILILNLMPTNGYARSEECLQGAYVQVLQDL